MALTHPELLIQRARVLCVLVELVDGELARCCLQVFIRWAATERVNSQPSVERRSYQSAGGLFRRSWMGVTEMVSELFEPRLQKQTVSC